MNRTKQQGMAALLITAILLVVALAFALGSYRGVFYQIKVANNEIEARKAHWKTEGGLECGFSYLVNNNLTSMPNNLNTICSSLGLTSLGSSLVNPSSLVSKLDNISLEKTIKFAGTRSPGAIRSTSDLIIRGSTLVSPPDPGPKNSDGKYECVAVVVSNFMIADAGVTNTGVGVHITKPSDDFDNSSDCADNNMTNTTTPSGVWVNSDGVHAQMNVENDIKREEDLNPFKDLFGYERGEWEKARDDTKFEFKAYTMSGTDVDCVSKFIDDLELGKPNKVWIDGSCQLNEAAITSIETVQSSHPGTYLFLMVHNGVLGIRGSGEIQGVVFHFNQSFASDINNWNDFDADLIADLNTVFDVSINTIYGSGSLLTAKHATYLQSGSFKFSGGMAFDTQGQMALFNNSMRLQYNSDIESSFTFATKPKWQKGSWNDL